jgi:hypothetical protein
MFAEGRSWRWWRWLWVRTNRANHKSMWQRFGVLRVKCQKAGLNRRPLPILRGGGSVLTQHQSRDKETDGQHDTRHGSSGRPSALLKMSCFSSSCSTPKICTMIILGLGKTTNSQDWFPAIQVTRVDWLFSLQEIRRFLIKGTVLRNWDGLHMLLSKGPETGGSALTLLYPRDIPPHTECPRNIPLTATIYYCDILTEWHFTTATLCPPFDISR